MKNLSQTLLALVLLCSTKILAQVPVYSSYPSAQAVLFLDFDGHTVTGTGWNYAGPIYCDPANLDSVQITEIFNRISEDYRPFNINVTTDPGKYSAAPVTKRMRALFTTSNGWYGYNAGGVAFIGSFTWGDNTPCFIFTALFNYNLKYISEAGSHELGHTLGLRHQSTYNASCTKTSDYNYGIGAGETGWAPIMGVGYYKNFTVWHNGPDSYGCNSTQNDLSVVTGSINGFGFRADDHSDNTNAGATTATFTGNQFKVDGVVSKTDDVDVFKFTLPEHGSFQLKAIPYNVGTGNTGSDLDLQIDLMDSAQNLLGTFNPGYELSSIIDTVLSSGTYYLKVDGRGNQYASEYGSLGSFSLQGNYTPVVLPLRKLHLKGKKEGSSHSLSWIIDADEAVVQQVIEVSDNGLFEPLSAVAAAARNYTYGPSTTRVLQYRLSVLFDNGRQNYSNIIALPNDAGKPLLFTNLVLDNVLIIKSPATFKYLIVAYDGRTVLQGTITRGNSGIGINKISVGAYLIQFSNGQDQYVQKFVKQ